VSDVSLVNSGSNLSDHSPMICTIDMFVEQVFTEVPSHATTRHCPWHKASPSDIQHYAYSVEEALSSIEVSDNLLTCCDHLAYLTKWSLILSALLLSNVFMILPVIQSLTQYLFLYNFPRNFMPSLTLF